MRLLKTVGSDADDWEPQLVDFRGEEYAILSHRWQPNARNEVLFTDIRVIDDGGPGPGSNRLAEYYINPMFGRRDLVQLPGYRKLRGAARLAAREGYDFIWIDTCCIDKSSSTELSEAINSMYKWYRGSQICFAYLEDVPNQPSASWIETGLGSDFSRSTWWSRCWTLQELVAPQHVFFYSKGWTWIGERKALAGDIWAITRIGYDMLVQEKSTEHYSVAQRMSWASRRASTRLEDQAYSLMAIFEINMPLLYGEGAKAFLRLQEEIIKVSDDQTLFAWTNPEAEDDEVHGLLASSPAMFLQSQDIVKGSGVSGQVPYSMSHLGLSISLPMEIRRDGTWLAKLHCYANRDQKHISLRLRQIGWDEQQYAPVSAILPPQTEHVPRRTRAPGNAGDAFLELFKSPPNKQTVVAITDNSMAPWSTRPLRDKIG
ncbi:Vegetative incompatibility protein HET-E-1 [Cyphellophora attinorum]|uniref:Vegetative incompatibility protein HET-E-1 n=1 Tax=Cyphellophora attinorum TaxID=1664694 RepID=A0A0N1NYJ9_9EURO|nr:Vegetative incompatibility protein HET-E-1 [Phialophora attinorum]KPI39944.1 Vegetative incompatibility protein HET-E-1 [Phialophora attinorum]